MERVTVSEDDVKRAVKEVLGFGDYIDLGPTGRRYNWRAFDTIHEGQEERAEFSLHDVAQRANVLTEDDFAYAAMDGIRKWLLDNNGELQTKLNAAAEALRQEQAETPLYWVVWGPEGGNTAAGWMDKADAESDLRCHLEGFHRGNDFIQHTDARLVEGPQPFEKGATS